MAFATVPTHGKRGAFYRLRPNGFVGAGLNDATWGLIFAGSASAYYEVEIDAEGAPDTFQWRKNGGTWTTGVSISGSAQTLDDGQQITFAATTGHTLGDKWVIGNLKDEPCTEAGVEAQITDAGLRIINPNNPPVFTDAGGASVQVIDFSQGQAVFSDNVTTVLASGNNGFIPLVALEKVGYIIDWNLSISVEMADISRMGEDWKEGLPGQSTGSGSANAYYIGTKGFMDAINAAIDGTQKYFFLQLFTWDLNQDQTGDHFQVWATLTGNAPSGNIGDVVKESMQFQTHLIPALIADS